MLTRQGGPERQPGARVVFGRDLEIPVPDVPPEGAEVGDAESQAVAAHPWYGEGNHDRNRPA